MRIHDISQRLGPGTAVWPGDQPVELSWTLRREHGDSVNVALLTMSVHAGTHIDGFLHVTGSGAAAAAMPLESYIGRCTVVAVDVSDEVRVEHVAHLDLTRVERVLFRTRRHVDETTFPTRFAHLAPQLVQHLADAGVRLIGTDSPSIDPVDSKTLDAHHVCVRGGVAILENVVLADVAPGEYTLIALPLRLEQADSSPVRAVLLEGGLT